MKYSDVKPGMAVTCMQSNNKPIHAHVIGLTKAREGKSPLIMVRCDKTGMVRRFHPTRVSVSAEPFAQETFMLGDG